MRYIVTRVLYRSASMRRTIYVAVAVWIVSLLLAVPDVVISQVNTSSPVPFCDAYHGHWTNYTKIRLHEGVNFHLPRTTPPLSRVLEKCKIHPLQFEGVYVYTLLVYN